MESGDRDEAVLNDILGELEDNPPVNEMEATNDFSLAEETEVEIMQTEEVEVAESSEVEVPDVSKVSAPKSVKVTEFPLSKIKGIMKMDPEVVMVGSEAVFAATKAAELFVQTLAKQAYKHTQTQKKKTIQRVHVDAAITSSESLFFLEDALD